MWRVRVLGAGTRAGDGYGRIVVGMQCPAILAPAVATTAIGSAAMTIDVSPAPELEVIFAPEGATMPEDDD